MIYVIGFGANYEHWRRCDATEDEACPSAHRHITRAENLRGRLLSDSDRVVYVGEYFELPDWRAIEEQLLAMQARKP